MARFDDSEEKAARSKVRRRGMWWLCVGAVALCAPFLLVALTDNVHLPAWTIGAAVIGLSLSPVFISAGVIDVFWPRTPTSPISRMQF